MTTIKINGIPTEAPAGAIAYKYADPTDGACWLYSEDDVRDIEREDPSLIVRVELTIAYSVNCIDSEAPAAWMDFAAKVTPGAQSDGRCAFRVIVDPSKREAFEAALDADHDVLTYSVEG